MAAMRRAPVGAVVLHDSDGWRINREVLMRNGFTSSQNVLLLEQPLSTPPAVRPVGGARFNRRRH
jgi:hypothetical protein